MFQKYAKDLCRDLSASTTVIADVEKQLINWKQYLAWTDIFIYFTFMKSISSSLKVENQNITLYQQWLLYIFTFSFDKYICHSLSFFPHWYLGNTLVYLHPKFLHPVHITYTKSGCFRRKSFSILRHSHFLFLYY